MKTFYAALLCWMALGSTLSAHETEMHRPSVKLIRKAAQQYVDRNVVCAIPAIPTADSRYNQPYWWEKGIPGKYNAAFEPFVRAGLLVRLETLNNGQTRYKVTAAGASRLKDCLIDADAYPEQTAYGFRIAERVVSGVNKRDLNVHPKYEQCFWSYWVVVYYRIAIDASWYDEKIFNTNLSTYPTDYRGRHFAIIPFTSSAGKWSIGRMPDPHQLPLCINVPTGP